MKKLLLIMALIISGMGLYAQNYNVIDYDLQEVLNQKNDEMIEINIILKSQIDNEKLNAKINNIKDKSDRKEYVLKELKDFSLKTQKDLMSVIQGEEKNNKILNINRLSRIVLNGHILTATTKNRDTNVSTNVIKFLREREIVHFQRFGEAIQLLRDKLDQKNVYYMNPAFDM